MNKSETAIQYREKYGYDMPTLKLARIMYNENKLMFFDVENARKTLRYIEGKTGKKDAKYKNLKLEHRDFAPFKYIEKETFEPFIISGCKRVGILNDVHLPYADKDALITAVTYLKDVVGIGKDDGILLNGDIIDCYQLSRFAKDPKKRDFKYEVDSLKSFFEDLMNIFGCKIFYKLGNHEARYEHFLMMKAHELKGIEDIEFKNIIKANQYGIDVIESNRTIKLNSLNAIHGHEFFGSGSGVNVARGLFLKSMSSCFQGHNHKTSEHTEMDMNGKIITTWSIGCLSHLHPEYMPLNKWNHGFAYVELDKNKEDFNFYNKRIYKGKVL